MVVIIALPSLAENKELVINGEMVNYDQENSLVQATGSVEVLYRDVRIDSQNIIYNTRLNRAWADNGFKLSYEQLTIEGRSLDYDVKAKSGRATDVHFTYHGIELSGKSIELAVDELKLKDASFTTCDMRYGKHYRVTAAEIVFYPSYGWLVAYWGLFWLGPLPVVPMPTYIFDLAASEGGRKNIPPFPDIGSNDEDGTYLNEHLAWHHKRELSGSYTLSYATKKGIGLGITADYIMDEASRGQARLFGNGFDGPYGGVTHSWSFGPERSAQPAGSFSFLELPKQRPYQIDALLWYRERINYQRVSYYPKLVLKGRQQKLWRDELNLDLELAAAQISEQRTVKLAGGSARLDLAWDLPETAWGDLTPLLGLDGRYYSNDSRWVRTTGGFSFVRGFGPNIKLGLGYLHYFSIDGASPFLFEAYRFSPADRLTSELNFLVGETGVSARASYFLDTWQPEDIDYGLLIKMHCYDLTVKYRSLRREFELGFALAGGE